MRRLLTLTGLVVLGCAASASAQGAEFPPPTTPVTICVAQAVPLASSYQLVFDAAAPEAVTLAAPVAGCPVSSTHSFTLPAARFTVGTHSIKLLPTNQFGTNTTSPIYPVTVGIAPGPATVTAVISGGE